MPEDANMGGRPKPSDSARHAYRERRRYYYEITGLRKKIYECGSKCNPFNLQTQLGFSVICGRGGDPHTRTCPCCNPWHVYWRRSRDYQRLRYPVLLEGCAVFAEGSYRAIVQCF